MRIDPKLSKFVTEVLVTYALSLNRSVTVVRPSEYVWLRK